ncbi:MAG: hypothetical protein ACJ71X_04040 [Nitrososphaeraceae archaeon]
MPDFILRSTPTYKWLKDPSNCSMDRKRIATFTIVCRIGYILASDVHKIRVSNVSCLLYLLIDYITGWIIHGSCTNRTR